MAYLEGNEIFTKRQHGFRPGKACTTQLLEILEEWNKTRRGEKR